MKWILAARSFRVWHLTGLQCVCVCTQKHRCSGQTDRRWLPTWKCAMQMNRQHIKNSSRLTLSQKQQRHRTCALHKEAINKTWMHPVSGAYVECSTISATKVTSQSVRRGSRASLLLPLVSRSIVEKRRSCLNVIRCTLLQFSVFASRGTLR